MPPLIHTRSTAWYYPATRDAKGFLLSDVQPGDVRDLDEAPDSSWEPATDEAVARMKAVRDRDAALAEAAGEADEAAETATEDSGGEKEEPGAKEKEEERPATTRPVMPPPAAPVTAAQPAPPAVIP